MDRPDTVVLGSLGSANVPVPPTSVQVPTAGGTAVFAVSWVEVPGVQSCWFGPASAAGCAGSKAVTVTWSEVVPQVR